jgi:tetratricopeptide (TPR) repeat protein
LAAGTAFARRTDSRVLAGAIALTALAVAGVALALTGQSGSSRISPAAVHGAVRAQGLAVAGPRRLQGAGSGSSSGGGLAARSSARAKAAASGGSGRGSARGGTQSGHEHAQPGSVPAAQLEARGHKLLGEGHYAAAIGDFRAALAASGQTSARCGVPGSEACLTYAYALYDLGRALRLAGKPGAAVPVLTKRLRIDNQRRTVQNELGLAKKAHGTGGAAAPSPKTKRPKKTPAPAAAPAPTSTPTTTTTGPAPPPAPSSPGPTGPTGSTAPAGPTGT